MDRRPGRAVRWVALAGALAAAGNVTALDRSLTWMASYNSPVNGDDVAQAIAIDPAGDVIVAGWARYARATTAADILVMKYDPNGNVLWSRTCGSFPGGEDYAFGVATAADGSSYVAGSVSNTGGASDGWLRKYDALGSVVWTMTYTSPSLGDQAVFYAVAVDPVSGSVYVAGTEVRSDLFQYGNGLVAKVAPATGALLWTATFDDAANLWDEALGVAVDPDGGAVVTGYETETDSAPGTSLSMDILARAVLLQDVTGLVAVDTRLVVHRFAADGTRLASLAPYNGDPAHVPNKESGHAVTVASDGSVCVGGVEELPGPEHLQRWVRKYGAPNGPFSGAPLWTKVIGEAGSGTDVSDLANGVALDPLGGILVAGESARDDLHQGENVTIEDFDPTAAFVSWNAHYDSGYDLDDVGTGVAASGSGRVVACGYSNRSDLAQKKNWVVLAYDPIPGVPPLLGNTRVWPSPFNPRTAVGGEAKFGPLPDGATVRIYTLGGRLVRELRQQGGMARWDGRNGDGTAVPEGVYLWNAAAKGQAPVQGTVAVSRQ